MHAYIKYVGLVQYTHVFAVYIAMHACILVGVYANSTIHSYAYTYVRKAIHM